MELLVLVLTAAVSCVTGSVISFLVNNSKRKRELDELEVGMCEQVEERYDAYLTLEARIRKAIRGFDRRALEFKRRLQNQKHNIEELKRALDEHESFAQKSLSDTSFLGFPASVKPAAPEPAESPATTENSFADALSQMDDWEQRAGEDLETKNVEIDRQSTQIVELTDQVKRLEPLSKTVFMRESEIEQWKQKYGELEAALSRQTQALEDVVGELGPKADELSDNEEAMGSLRTRFEERLAAKEGELDELSTRNEELQVELSRTASEVQELKGRVEELVRTEPQVEELVQRNEQLGEDLRERVETVAMLEQEIDEIEQDAGYVAGLVTRNTDLEAELKGRSSELLVSRNRCDVIEEEGSTVQCELEERVVELAQRAARVEGLEQEVARLETVLAGSEEKLTSFSAEHETAVADLLSRLDSVEREGRKKLNAAEKKLKTAKKKLAGTEKDLGKSRMSLAEAEQAAKDLNGRIEQTETELAESVRRATEGEGRIEEYEQRVTNGEVLLAELGSRLEEAEALVRDSAQRAADNEARMAEQERRIAYDEAQVAEMKAELADARTHMADAEQRHAQGEQRAEVTIGELRGDLDSVSNDLQELRSVHEGLVTKVEWQADVLIEKDVEIKERDARVEGLDTHVKELALHLSSTSESLSGEKSRIGQLMAELDHAQETAATRTSRISQAQSLLETLRPVLENLESTLVSEKDKQKK